MMPKKLMACVRQVKRRQRNLPEQEQVDPWAVCVASTGQRPHRKRKTRKGSKRR